jgi:hypothetical protein
VPIAAQFVVWSERRSPQFDPAPVKGCETLYQKRPKETAPLVSEISNPPAVFSPPQGLTELGAPRQLYAASPKQTANFVQRQALFASAANLGARQGSAAFAQTQLANVGQAQTLFGPGPTPVSGLGARRGSNPTPQTQSGGFGSASLRASAHQDYRSKSATSAGASRHWAQPTRS